MSGIKTMNTIVYAGRVKNQSTLMQCSSGGAFVAISNIFLEKGDIVAAAIYNYQTHTTEFKMLRDTEERDLACGSKYMQSKPGNIFQESYQWLNNHPEKKLLFVGMGCQADGFRRFAELKGIREHVFIIDIICHGSPSPKLWREYADSVERHNYGKITYLTFKDKRNGWNRPTALVKINNKEISIGDYIKIFYSQCALRPSCHECPYATTERLTDMTIGDYWHIEDKMPEFYDPNGNSVFLIHTNKGMEVFEEIKKAIDCRLSNTRDCWQENLESPTPVSAQRSVFWQDYQKQGVQYVMKKYGTISFAERVKNKIKSKIGGYLLNGELRSLSGINKVNDCLLFKTYFAYYSEWRIA